jgi:hypothetical protein
MKIIECKFYIHFNDITGNSSEKCNYTSLARIEPAPCNSGAALDLINVYKICTNFHDLQNPSTIIQSNHDLLLILFHKGGNLDDVFKKKFSNSN